MSFYESKYSGVPPRRRSVRVSSGTTRSYPSRLRYPSRQTSSSSSATTTSSVRYMRRKLAAPAVQRRRPNVSYKYKPNSVRRVGRRFRGKYKFPAWFNNIKRLSTVSVMSQRFSGQITHGGSTGANISATAFVFHGKSPHDVDNACIYSGAGAAASSSGPQNTKKGYVFDYTRHHQWMNATSAADVNLTFWKATARRDIPSSSLYSGLTFAPDEGTSTSSALVINPTGWTQPFATAETATVAGYSRLSYDDVSNTPFDNTPLCEQFRLKKLYVNFPDGRKHSGILAPGQVATLQVSRPRPVLERWQKYGLTSIAVPVHVQDAYNILRGQSLIITQVRGTVGHDPANTAHVGVNSTFYVDYFASIQQKLVSSAVLNKISVITQSEAYTVPQTLSIINEDTGIAATGYIG